MRKGIQKLLTGVVFLSLMVSFNLSTPRNANASTQQWSFSANGTQVYSGSIQTWTVPYSANYQIEAVGAEGGGVSVASYSEPYFTEGGYGADIKGDFYLTQGTVLKILVGKMGGWGTSYDGGGGGGGSFVADSSNNPLIVAGGGGGGFVNPPVEGRGIPASTTTSGQLGNWITNQYQLTAGANGSGGDGWTDHFYNGYASPEPTGYGSGGGGGFYGSGYYNGAGCFYLPIGTIVYGFASGQSFVSGGYGGNIGQQSGGYGGGGGGGSTGGGGGGYSGGGAGDTDGWAGPGGGGGSYNGGTNQSNIISTNNRDGYVNITLLNSPPNISISSPVSNKQFSPGATMTLSGSINDPDARGTMYVQYNIDGGSTVTASTLTDTSYNQTFSDGVFLPSNLSIGWHTLNVWGADDEGGVSVTQSIAFYIKDTIPPTLNITGNPTAWTNQNVTLTASASDNVSVYGIELPNGNWVNSSTVSYIISANGSYTFTAQDSSGNQTSQTVNVTMIDETPPALPTMLLSDSNWTNASNVTATISANGDVGSGVKQVEYSLSGATNQGWTIYNSPLVITNEGKTTVSARVLDVAGNYSLINSQTVKIDRTDPNATIISSPADLTNTPVTLTVNATDVGSGVQRIKLPDGTWIYGNVAQCVVNDNQTVTFEIEDEAGNIKTEQYTVNNIKKDVLITNNPNVTLELSADDFLSGVAQMRLKNENDAWSSWESYSTTQDWKLDPEDGLKHVWAEYEDGAGNISNPVEDIIILDQTPPVVSNLQINNGDEYTGDPNVTLSLSATDNLTGVKNLMISNDNETWTTIPYATTIPWTIANNSDGIKTVYVKAIDGAGNISTASTAQIFLDTTKPTAGILIDGGATETGSRDVILTLTFADSGSGVASVQVVEGDNTYTLPSTATSPTTLPWTLDYGTTQTVTIVVTDKVGNVATASATISVDKLQIQSFTLTNVVNPTQPFSPKVWPFVPQNMLAGANISFAINLKAPYDASVVKDSVTYKVEVTGADYDKVIFGNMHDSGGDVFSKTVTLPNDAPTGAKVYISAVAQRQLEVAPYDLQTVYFPGDDSTTMAQVGVIQDNVDDLIRFNETY